MNTAAVLPPLLLGRAIDRALSFTAGRASAAAVAWAALVFAGGTLATEGPRVLKRWFLITANGRIRAALRADALRGVLSWPLAGLHETTVGDVMSRIISDVEVVGVGIRELTIETWDTLLLCASLAVTLLVMSPRLSLVALAPVPFAMLVALASGRWVARRTRAVREANGRLTEGIHESIVATRLARLFGRGARTIAGLERLSSRVARANVGVTRMRAGLQPAYSLLMTAGFVLVVWRGAENVLAGAMTTGALVAYLEIFLRFVARGPRIPQLVNSVQSGAAAFERLRGLLPEAIPPASPLAQPAVAGATRVSLAGVTFRYPGASRPALWNISLEIPAGSVVVVTGPVGSGKSALARALVGLYPLEGGTLRREPAGAPVGYLAQDPQLFSGTLADNIARSRTVSTPRSASSESGSRAGMGNASPWPARSPRRLTVCQAFWCSMTRSRRSTSTPSPGSSTPCARPSARPSLKPLIALGDEWQSVQTAIAGAERILEVLGLPEEPAAVAAPILASTSGPAIAVTEVRFGYSPDREIVRGLSLEVQRGEHIVIVGRTGAGKTSTLHLLAGLYAPWAGTIQVAGVDPRSLPPEARRHLIGVVPQTVQLFGGTVLDNLTFGDPDVAREAVERACAVVGADAFIRALPDGLATVLRGLGGGPGVELSAGQNQLLSLARALVFEPKVLLLDEATAAVDAATDTALRAALRASVLPRGCAVVTIAHRLSTSRDADRFIVLERGRIVEDGAPDRLASAGGRFAAWLELEAAGWDSGLDERR